MRGRSSTRRAVVALLGALLVALPAACAEADPDEGFPPAAPLPRSAGVALTEAQVADAAPCSFLDPQAFAGYRPAVLEESFDFNTCNARLSTAAGPAGEVRLEVRNEITPATPGGGPPVPEVRGGVTVLVEPGDANFCNRQIVLGDTAVLLLSGFGLRSPDGTDLCALADDAVDAALPRLSRGVTAAQPAAPGSLAHQNACRLLVRSDWEDVPGIDAGRREPGARGQNCTWGAPQSDRPNVYLSFSRYTDDRPGEGGRTVTVGGRPGALSPLEVPGYPPTCTVRFRYRSLDEPVPSGPFEIVTVTVTAPEPVDAVCARVETLANAAQQRLLPT